MHPRSTTLNNPFPTAEAATLLLATVMPRACPPDAEDAERFVLELIEERVARVLVWESSRTADGSLRGVVAVSEGRAEKELWVVADPRETEAEWFTGALDRILESMAPERIAALIDPRYGFARDMLRARGFGIAKVHLDGRVKAALTALGDGDGHPTDDVYFELATRDDVEDITAARVRFFRCHRAVCFGSDAIDEGLFERIETSQRAAVQAAVEGDTQALWMVRRQGDGQAVGSFGLSVSSAHPLFGAIAGMDFNLSDEYVGRGFSRAMYRTMLHRAQLLGIERFRGTTWNPAVLHLAGPLDRRVVGWFLRTTGPFIAHVPGQLLSS